MIKKILKLNTLLFIIFIGVLLCFIPNVKADNSILLDYNKSFSFTGANNSYSKKRASIEAIKYYRDNYQRRLMQVKRSDDAEIKIAFEKWKKVAKLKIKELDKKRISEEELLCWLKENKDL